MAETQSRPSHRGDLLGGSHCRADRRLAQRIARRARGPPRGCRAQGQLRVRRRPAQGPASCRPSPQVDFLSLSSYRKGTTSSGQVEIVRDIEAGLPAATCSLSTISWSRAGRWPRQGPRRRARGGAGAHLRAAGEAGAAGRRIAADFSAFECPDVFVVGYGMDLAPASASCRSWGGWCASTHAGRATWHASFWPRTTMPPGTWCNGRWHGRSRGDRDPGRRGGAGAAAGRPRAASTS